MLRRLAAILVADVVGYSRLTERDEAQALTRMRSLRHEVIEPLVAQHQGRIVKFMGDGVLIEFASVVDAVRCAIAIQHEAAARQSGIPPDRKLVLRIGINLGDIVVEGNDVLGDGVNIAARLEHLCEPGGILVSGTVYDQLHGKIEVGLQFVGEQKVKNLERKVRAYKVRLKQEAKGRRPSALPLRHVAAGVGALLVLALASGGAWWWLASDAPPGAAETALQAPDAGGETTVPQPVLTGSGGGGDVATAPAPSLTAPAGEAASAPALAPAAASAPALAPAAASAPAPAAVSAPPPQALAHARPVGGLELTAVPDDPALDRVGELRRYIALFDGGECFLAVPIEVSSDAASIEAYATAAPPVQVLDESFRRDQGFEPTIGMRQVTPEQCAAVDFARTATRVPELTPNVYLDSFALKDGETLSGTVRETGGRSMAVLLVSDDGTVHNLSDTLRSGAATANFDVSLTSPRADSTKPLLLVVIATPQPLGALSPTLETAKADALFARISEEAKLSGGDVGVALKYLKLSS